MAPAHADAELGRRDEALREAGRAVALMPVRRDAIDGPNLLYDFAQVATVVGARDQAVAFLAQLLAVPSDITVPLLRVEPARATG